MGKRIFLFAWMWVLLVLTGCAPIRSYQCTGGLSGATEWHTIEAPSLDDAREDGGFGECRKALIESVVGVDYATTSTTHCAGMMVIHAKWITSPKWPWAETIEVFTDHGAKRPSDIVVSIWASRLQWDQKANAKSKEFVVMTSGPAYLRPYNDVVVRCWSGDVPQDARNWPAEGTYTAGGGIYQWTDITWMQHKLLGEVYAPQKCQEWSTQTDSLVWAPKDGVARMYCRYELAIRGQFLSSDGHWELGALQYPFWQGHKMCGPTTYASSVMHKIIVEEVPRQIPSTANWQEVDFVGACWKEKDPKPPMPANWSGRNEW